MNITTKKINNESIKIIPVPKSNPSEIKGYNIISYLYANIYICGPKRTGKTNIIFKIIESCIDSDTKVIVFCSTHDNDGAWLYIKKYFEKHNIQAQFYSSLFEDNVDQLENLLAYIREVGKQKQIDEEEKKNKKVSDFIEIVRFDNNTKEVKVKIKKKKKKAPEFMIIFVELKKSNVPFLLKTFRHYKSKVIVSSQFLNDLDPQARQQIDIWLLLKNHPKERLEKIYGDIGCNIDFELFYKLYHEVTSSVPH